MRETRTILLIEHTQHFIILMLFWGLIKGTKLRWYFEEGKNLGLVFTGPSWWWRMTSLKCTETLDPSRILEVKEDIAHALCYCTPHCAKPAYWGQELQSLGPMFIGPYGDPWWVQGQDLESLGPMLIGHMVTCDGSSVLKHWISAKSFVKREGTSHVLV